MAEKHTHDIQTDARFVEPCCVEMAEVVESQLCSVDSEVEPAYGVVETLVDGFESGSGCRIDKV